MGMTMGECRYMDYVIGLMLGNERMSIVLQKDVDVHADQWFADWTSIPRAFNRMLLALADTWNSNFKYHKGIKLYFDDAYINKAMDWSDLECQIYGLAMQLHRRKRDAYDPPVHPLLPKYDLDPSQYHGIANYPMDEEHIALYEWLNPIGCPDRDDVHKLIAFHEKRIEWSKQKKEEM